MQAHGFRSRTLLVGLTHGTAGSAALLVLAVSQAPGRAVLCRGVKMEPYLCDVVSMGTIASNLFDCADPELYDFAVNHLEEMLNVLRARYYALDFPRRSAGTDRSESVTASGWRHMPDG